MERNAKEKKFQMYSQVYGLPNIFQYHILVFFFAHALFLLAIHPYAVGLLWITSPV